MAVRTYCDICKDELHGDIDRFFCMIVLKQIRELSQMVAGKLQITPQIQEKNYHLCRKCFNEKLPQL